MLTRLYNFFSSVKLAVVLLALGLLIVFFGTLAQGHFGLYIVQGRYFQSLFIDLQAMYVGFHKFLDMLMQGFGHPLEPLDPNAVLSIPRVPVFPGGYLVGGLLLINLFTAHLRYYQSGWKKFGIVLIHVGVVLLLLGQLATDLFSVESHMSIREGAAANYSESGSRWELAIIDPSDAKEDKVVAIPASLLETGRELSHPELPFKLRTKVYHINSAVAEANESNGMEPVAAENAFGRQIFWRGLPKETRMNFRDIPSGIVELVSPQGESRPILVSGYIARPLTLSAGDRVLQFVLRPERYYNPYYLHLIDFRFDRYAGTDRPKNYSSRVRVERPGTGENREVTIRMNEPLRYDGKTFFQSSFDKADEKGTVLQVVNNPWRMAPYIGCYVVSFGMIWQFLAHLIGFAAKRKTT
jgi:hypothetical protein